jgi:hypothetical protein
MDFIIILEEKKDEMITGEMANGQTCVRSNGHDLLIPICRPTFHAEAIIRRGLAAYHIHQKKVEKEMNTTNFIPSE